MLTGSLPPLLLELPPHLKYKGRNKGKEKQRWPMPKASAHRNAQISTLMLTLVAQEHLTKDMVGVIHQVLGGLPTRDRTLTPKVLQGTPTNKEQVMAGTKVMRALAVAATLVIVLDINKTMVETVAIGLLTTLLDILKAMVALELLTTVLDTNTINKGTANKVMEEAAQARDPRVQIQMRTIA